MIKKELEVHSVFTSISGEVGYFRQGEIVRFLRLQGCNMRCPWCDTEQSQESGVRDLISIDQVADQIGDSRNILVTGGEPLLQQDALLSLIRGFRDDHYTWQIETNGTILPLSALRMMKNVHWVVDRKYGSARGLIDPYRAFTTGLGFKAGFKLVDGFPLTENDWLKYVVFNMDELNGAVEEINDLCYRAEVEHGPLPHFAISGIGLSPKTILERMMEEYGSYPLAVVNIQLHKLVDME